MTTTGYTLQDGPYPPREQSARFGFLIAIIAVLILGGLVGFLRVGASHYYVLTPGNAPVVTASSACRPAGGGSFSLANGTPCVQLVVPSGKAHDVSGSIMMVDVYEGKPNIFQYAEYKLGLLSHQDEFLPNAAIVGVGSASQVQCQNDEEAVQAVEAAPVAALTRLGYKVTESNLGAQIDTVVSGTAAQAAGLRCDDLIVAINGHPVHTDGDVTTVVKPLKPGQEITVTVQRPDNQGHARTIQIKARLTGTPAIGQTKAKPDQAFLGIVSETRTQYNLPFQVSANVGSIGGPSDGLALTLGLIDTLDQGKLTNGLKIAATGQIDPDGTVEAIGGAAQKAVAVRHAGATVFFVPTANYRDAKSEAGSMKVFAVGSLNQALQDLKSLGGQIPATPGAPTVTTAAG
ncbi:MAG TPA: PDZ domain-containing protein [Acidimicrobiales bacterium]|nr:PDZ domain-containing protein [Acidimicrobiales bacterium]